MEKAKAAAKAARAKPGRTTVAAAPTKSAKAKPGKSAKPAAVQKQARVQADKARDRGPETRSAKAEAPVAPRPSRAKDPVGNITVPRAAAPLQNTSRSNAPDAEQTRPLLFYFWPTPAAWMVAIMLEECGLAYVVQPVDAGRGEQFAPSYLAISPDGRVPALIDPEGPGGKPISLFEGRAMLKYLGEKTGRLYPDEPRARADADQWLFFQAGSLAPWAEQAQHFRHFAPEPYPYAIQRFSKETQRLYALLEERLKGRDFIAGRYSISDIALWTTVLSHSMQGQDLSTLPHVRRWFERIAERGAVQRGRALGAHFRGTSAAKP